MKQVFIISATYKITERELRDLLDNNIEANCVISVEEVKGE
jgi:hypothetical protein